MTTQKIVIGVIIALILIGIIVWIVNMMKKPSKNTTTPSNTDTGTGGIRRETFQQNYQRVQPVNSGMNGGVPSGARVSGVNQH